MRRIFVFGALIFGFVLAGFFLLQGTAFDAPGIWNLLVSWFRRGVDQVSGTLSSDPYQKAIGLIAGFEGFSAKAYPDADGFSIGYGHFITADDPYDASSEISESEAHNLLESDAQSALACVQRNVGVPLNPNQLAALVSFVYNVGCGAFQGSAMLKKINAGDFSGAAQEFPRWNKSKGIPLASLATRRTSEMEIFAS